MENIKLDVGQLFGALGEETRRSAIVVVVTVAALTIVDVALDRAMPDRGSFAISGFASMVGQYLLTRTALTRSNMLSEGAPSRFGSFWGMCIGTGLLALFGFILLILPGLYLLARWFVAGPAIIAEDKTAGEGMSTSWELTRDTAWPIVGALLIVYACGFGAGILPLFFFSEKALPLSVQVLSSGVINAAVVLAWLMAIGTYRLIAGGHRSLEEVFA
jgi:hypothetical protein